MDQYVLLREAMEVCVFVGSGLSGCRVDASWEVAGRVAIEDGVRRVIVRFC